MEFGSRVALGITCVQCTPVQLELLRRAGAMPVSSRRCGMITKREAERLCKSFLAETAPPKLPDSFSFDVYHHCAWGCRGAFNPSRYNSSRYVLLSPATVPAHPHRSCRSSCCSAKCIKCCYCGLFFSPNKFIFHSHRLPESKYVQPDAANFNSWRRHIKLSANPPDEVMFAWEDVKAMFNGGSRKRAMAASLTSVSKQQQQKRQQQQQQQQASRILMSEESGGSSPLSFTPSPVKRPRLSPASPPDITSGLLTSASSEAKTSPSSSSSSTGSSGGLSNSHLAGPPYPFPLIPLHGNKAYGALMQGLAPTPFPRSSLTHLSSSPRPPGPGPASPHGFRATPISPIFSESSQHDVRQSFAELMGTSLLLPYNYFQLSRYWPPRPPTTTAPSQILDMSSSRQRLAFGMTDNGLATAASLAEKVLAGGEGGHGWDREQESQRSGLSHGGSAFKPVSKNLCPGIASSAKGSAFRAENLISNCTRSCSPADSARSEDEENEVDVIGGEEDGMRDRNGRRHRDSGSPLQNRAESSSHSESFEVRSFPSVTSRGITFPENDCMQISDPCCCGSHDEEEDKCVCQSAAGEEHLPPTRLSFPVEIDTFCPDLSVIEAINQRSKGSTECWERLNLFCFEEETFFYCLFVCRSVEIENNVTDDCFLCFLSHRRLLL